MVTAEFITKRYITTFNVQMSTGSSECGQTGDETKTKVLVASSATTQPTDMNNGKNKKRRHRVPSFINPLTGRPTTLSVAILVFGVVFIYYLMTRFKNGGKGDIDESAKNPKFQHILNPLLNNPDDGDEDDDADVEFPRVRRPDAFHHVPGGGQGEDQLQLVPKVPKQPLMLNKQHFGQEQNQKRTKVEPHPKPKEFPVEVIYKPDLRCPDKPYILFLVVCMPGMVLARTGVRRTWGKPQGITEATGLSLSWRTVFVMGRTEVKDEQIARESKHHGDILQGDFEDLSSEVTRKVMLGFQWAVQDIPAVCRPKFIFKTNARVYMNLPTIVPWIRSGKLQKDKDLYVGKLLRDDYPIRDKLNPLYVPYSDFPRTVFPNIARGPLYMFSTDVVQRMVPNFDSITPIAMEDAYVGLLAERVGVRVTDDDHFVLIKKPSNFCHYQNMVFIFDLEPTEVMHVYNVVEEKHRYSECTDKGL